MTETLAPGTSESIQVTARPSETGTYTLNGEIIYFPEGQSEDAQAERISLSISRTAERGLLYWTPTIIAALISGGLTISMLFSTRFRKMNPNAEAYALGVIIHLTIGTLVMYVSLGVLLSPVVDSVGSVVVLAFLYAFF